MPNLLLGQRVDGQETAQEADVGLEDGQVTALVN